MADDGKDAGDTPKLEDMSLLSITDGENERGIPFVKFIDDVEAFARTFSPPATAEVLIGAYSELHSKFKTFETSLSQKSKSPFNPRMWSGMTISGSRFQRIPSSANGFC